MTTYNYVDEAGNKHGKLAVVRSVPRPDHRKGSVGGWWLCRCDCGGEIVAYGSALRTGETVSCGCNWKELAGAHKVTHGESHTQPYRNWANIKARCMNPNDKAYPDYGGRGIELYEPWRYDYPAFRAWILANLGERPDGCSLDRIDNDGNYEPGNVRWATTKEQRANQRTRYQQRDVNQLQREYDDLAAWITRGMTDGA